VGNDDSTLYIPAASPSTSAGELYAVSGQTGQLLNSVALSAMARKAILSIDGSTAYVVAYLGNLAQLVAIDTATLATKETISFGTQSELWDIALSPDGTTLYASVICAFTCGAPPPGGCTVVSGICIFNASTLAFENQVAQLAGNLAVSEDGTSLYVTLSSRSEYLYIVNTSSLAISRIQVSAHYTIQGPVVVSPTGHYGLVFVGPNAEMSTTAFVLDTSTNTISKPFFGNAPGGASVVTVGFLETGKPVAFAPDGTSVWMLLACYSGSTNCTTPGGTGKAVFGISITAGAVIAETSVPSDAESIAFPY
jgi:DNA-binding beta-propeller fold protein YncE